MKPTTETTLRKKKKSATVSTNRVPSSLKHEKKTNLNTGVHRIFVRTNTPGSIMKIRHSAVRLLDQMAKVHINGYAHQCNELLDMRQYQTLTSDMSTSAAFLSMPPTLAEEAVKHGDAAVARFVASSAAS